MQIDISREELLRLGRFRLDELEATTVDVTSCSSNFPLLVLARPVTRTTYVEFFVSKAQPGTEVSIHSLGDEREINHRSFAFRLYTNSGVPAVCFDADESSFRIPALDGTWSQAMADEPVAFGLLVDMSRGCVALRLNDREVCIELTWGNHPGFEVQIAGFPLDLPHYRPSYVSCATSPPPPSLLAVAPSQLGSDGMETFYDAPSDDDLSSGESAA